MVLRVWPARRYRPVWHALTLCTPLFFGMCSYRSSAWVVAIPVLLILALLVLLPRGGNAPIEFSRATEPFGRAGLQGGATGEKYAVVIDAGSTGSRVHIFKFLVVGGALELQFDKFEQLKPGLSSFADNPPAAAESLKPLLDLALQTVPQPLHKCVSEGGCWIGAGWGSRLGAVG